MTNSWVLSPIRAIRMYATMKPTFFHLTPWALLLHLFTVPHLLVWIKDKWTQPRLKILMYHTAVQLHLMDLSPTQSLLVQKQIMNLLRTSLVTLEHQEI